MLDTRGGMRSAIFSVDNGLMRFFSKIYDIVLLNLLFLIGCIPIVTIGPSLSALYSMTLKMVRNEESYIVHGFWKAWRENFRQGTIFGMIGIIYFIVITADLFFTRASGEGQLKLFKIFCYSMLLLGYAVFLYVFPLIARFVYTWKEVFQNACFMSIVHLPQTIFMVLLNIPILLMALYSGITLLLLLSIMLVFGFSGMAMIQSILFRKIFERYELPVEKEGLETDLEEKEKYGE